MPEISRKIERVIAERDNSSQEGSAGNFNRKQYVRKMSLKDALGRQDTTKSKAKSP